MLLPLLLPLLTLHQGPAAWAADGVGIDIPHERYQLENGLDVILLHDPSLPQVVVNTWYGVGSKDEVAGRSGFAHLFEHLMFMGTERLPGSGFDELMEAEGGWNNAWTSEDATDYYDVGPSNLLPTLLWMEADRMDGLARAMTRKKVDLQRDVVRNERRQSSEDEPYGALWLEMPAMLYPPGHPYAHTVIGTHEDLQAASVDDVVAFFQTWYGPNNAGLVVAGDFDVATTKADIQRLFGGIAKVPLQERVLPEPVDKPQKALLELTDQVQVPMSVMLWHTDAALSQGDAVMDVLAAVLGDGRSSRLYSALIQQDSLALEVDAYQMSAMLGSVFMISAKPAEGHDLPAVEAAVQAQLSRLAAEGPTPEELDRVRNGIELSFLRSLEDLQDRAASLNRYRYLKGDPGWVSQDLARYRAVTAADVQAAAARLSPDRRALIRVHAEGADRPGVK